MKLDQAALDQLFLQGRSFNHYTDRSVSPDDLHAIWDLMKMGPTSINQQPARLVWCHSQEAKDRLAEAVGGTNGAKIAKAPVTVVIGMDVDFHENLPELAPNTGAKSWFDGKRELREASAFRNSSLQGAYLIMAARALGLDTGPMSGFDAGKVDAAFFADTPAIRTNFIATVGYGDRATLHDRYPRPAFDRFNRIA